MAKRWNVPAGICPLLFNINLKRISPLKDLTIEKKGALFIFSFLTYVTVRLKEFFLVGFSWKFADLILIGVSYCKLEII